MSVINIHQNPTKIKNRRTVAAILLFLTLIYADLLFVSALALELDNAVLESEERIVSADADIVTGMDLRSALTDNDAAREHCLPVLTLDAEALCLTVTAVVGGTRSLFMRE